MKKYNYFDDPPERETGSDKNNGESKKLNVDFKKLFTQMKSTIDDFVHGEALDGIKKLREKPSLQIRFMRLLAFALFVIFICVIVIMFSHTINSQNKKNERFCSDAGRVCSEYISEYGATKWELMDSTVFGEDTARMLGLCYARQMDFDNDGKDELMVCYNDKNVYYMDIWSYIGKEFTKVYSQPLNSTQDELDGSWAGLYRKNNKYYICQSHRDDASKVELHALRGDSFSKTSQCDYDYKNNIYSVKGKINAQDFETIKLSVIKASKAEEISETVIGNIESFSDVSIASIENQKSDEQKKAEAYYEIVEKRNQKYGQAKVVTNAGKSFIDGVAMVKLIDFDTDSNDELFIVYRKMLKQSATNAYSGEPITIEQPTYCMEVYSWNGTVANKIFSRDSISNLLNDKNSNYVLLQTNGKKTNICTNTYSFVSSNNYTAVSRIFEMKDGEFETIHNAKIVNEYGWKQYYLNDERSWESQFRNTGYKVAMFMDDNDSVDNSEYSMTYLSGDKGGGFDSVVSSTVKSIQSLNKNYSPEK